MQRRENEMESDTSAAKDKSRRPVIGVVALQGAVEEHCVAVRKAGGIAVPIRRPDEFADKDGIILPGGESTTMAIVGEQSGVFDSLREWVSSGKPVWGTCAGMILLSNTAIKSKDGGQSLVGGLDVQVCRNYFGSQIASCQIPLPVPEEVAIPSAADGDDKDGEASSSAATRAPFPAVFIRAPAILTVGDSVKVLCKLRAKPQRAAMEEVRRVLGAPEDSDDFCPEIIVAAQSGNILATAFHPELTDDDRWHRYFLKMVSES